MAENEANVANYEELQGCALHDGGDSIAWH